MLYLLRNNLICARNNKAQQVTRYILISHTSSHVKCGSYNGFSIDFNSPLGYSNFELYITFEDKSGIINESIEIFGVILSNSSLQ